jgi:hypothetical protein
MQRSEALERQVTFLEGMMNRRTASLLGVIVTVTTTSALAQWLNYQTSGIPRTADGKPNLTAPAPRTPGGRTTHRVFHVAAEKDAAYIKV